VIQQWLGGQLFPMIQGPWLCQAPRSHKKSVHILARQFEMQVLPYGTRRASGGVRVPSSHQQSDKASDDQWFEPEPATTAMLAYAELRNEMRANATKKPEKGEGHEINCCETLRRPC